MRVICPTTEAEYFCAKGWLTQISLIGLKKSAFWRSGSWEILDPLHPRFLFIAQQINWRPVLRG
jgi:hypothetical protein